MVSSVQGISKVGGASAAALRAAGGVGSADAPSAVGSARYATAASSVGGTGAASATGVRGSFAVALQAVSGAGPSGAVFAVEPGRQEQRADCHRAVMELRLDQMERQAQDLRERVESALDGPSGRRRRPRMLSAPEAPRALLLPAFPST